MRWPIKHQIMVPMTAVMLVTVPAMSVFQAWWAARQTREQTIARIRQVTDTLAEATFPMNAAVLEQMKGLSGAELVVQSPDGAVAATTRADWSVDKIPPRNAMQHAAEFQLAEPIDIEGERLFHAALATRPALGSGAAHALHVFYPENRYVKRQGAFEYIGKSFNASRIEQVIERAMSGASSGEASRGYRGAIA